MNVHESMIGGYIAEGWVVVKHEPPRATLAHPKHHCLHRMPYGSLCLMDTGHRGRHSTVAFYCDGCGKTRRGQPHLSDHEQGVDFCFLCVTW